MVLLVMAGTVKIIAGRMVHTCLVRLRSVHLVKKVHLRLVIESIVLHAGLLVLALDHVIIVNISVNHRSVQILLHDMEAFVFAQWRIARGLIMLGRCVLCPLLRREALTFKSGIEVSFIF